KADDLAVGPEQRSTAVAGVHGSIRLNQPRPCLTLDGDGAVEATDGTLGEGDGQPLGEAHRSYRTPDARWNRLEAKDVAGQRLVQANQRHVITPVQAHDTANPGVATGGHPDDGGSIYHV